MAEHPIVAAKNAQCEKEIAGTPEAYRKFMVVIPQSQKLKDGWITYNNAYMQVDGRIQMAIDEHIEHKSSIDIRVSYEQLGKSLMAVATVQCPLRGTATGHLRVVYPTPFKRRDGTVVEPTEKDWTNALAKAETGAIGRALGFVGYGLTGNGIASADEMEGHEGTSEATPPTPPSQTPEPVRGDRNPEAPATPRQLAFLRELLEKAGCDEGLIERAMARVTTRTEASNAIEKMRRTDAGVPSGGSSPAPSQWETRRRFLNVLITKHSIDRASVHQYMAEHGLGVTEDLQPSTMNLTAEGLEQVIAAIEGGHIPAPVGTSRPVVEMQGGEPVDHRTAVPAGVNGQTGEIEEDDVPY